MPGLSVLTLNINNPSADRAEKQLAWLSQRCEDVLVLTETKASEGCTLLAEAFTAAGYAVVFPEPAPREYGVLIASRVALDDGQALAGLDYLPTRAATATIPTDHGTLRLVGVYAPSRDASPEKVERKRRWLSAFTTALDSPTGGTMGTVLVGDLNVIEPDHQPRYPQFLPFEYDFYRALTADHDLVDAYRLIPRAEPEHSWVGRTGDGYRYDHAFCSTTLSTRVASCSYVHEPRTAQPRLTDHSGLAVHLNVTASRRLVTSDPSDAASPPTLF